MRDRRAYLVIFVLLSAVLFTLSTTRLRSLPVVTLDIKEESTKTSEKGNSNNLHSSEPQKATEEPSSQTKDRTTANPSTLVEHITEDALTTEPTTSDPSTLVEHITEDALTTEPTTPDPSILVEHITEGALTTEPTTSIISPNPTDVKEPTKSETNTTFSVTQPSPMPTETVETASTLVQGTTETNELRSSEVDEHQGTFVKGPTSVALTTEMRNKRFRDELCDNYWLFAFLAPRSGSTSVLGALYRQNEMQVTGEIGFLVKQFARIYSELFGLDDSKAGSWKATNLYTDEQIEEARMGYLKQLQFLFKLFAFPGKGDGLKNNFGDSVSHLPVDMKIESKVVADYIETSKKVIAFKMVRACDDAKVMKFYTEHLFPCAKFIVGGREKTSGNFLFGSQERGTTLWARCTESGKKLQKQSPRRYLAYAMEEDLTPTYLTRVFQWLGVHDSCKVADVPYSNKNGYDLDYSPLQTEGDCTFDDNKLRNAFPDVNHNWTATKGSPFFNVNASYVNTTTLNQVLAVGTPLSYLIHFLSFLKPVSQVCLDDKFQMGLQGQPLDSITDSSFASYEALHGMPQHLCTRDRDPVLCAWSRNGKFQQPRTNRVIMQLLDFTFPSPDASCTDRIVSETGRLRLAYGRASTIKGMRFAKLIHPSTRFFMLKSASARSPFNQEDIEPFRELGLEFEETIPGRFPHYAEFDYGSVDGLNNLLKFLGVTGCKFLEAFNLDTEGNKLQGGKLSSTKCEFNRILIKEVKAFDNTPDNEDLIRKGFENSGYNSATSNLIGEVCGIFLH